MMMVVATAPLVLMFFCGAWAVMMMSVMNFMMMFVRIFTMAFMMMFVRKFHFFHNFAILLVLYTPEHSVPFFYFGCKITKRFLQLGCKNPSCPLFLADSLTPSFGFFGKVRRNVKMIAHREDCLRIEVVSFLPCGLLLPAKHHEVQLQGNWSLFRLYYLSKICIFVYQNSVW